MISIVYHKYTPSVCLPSIDAQNCPTGCLARPANKIFLWYQCVFNARRQGALSQTLRRLRQETARHHLGSMSTMRIVDILKACKQTKMDQALGMLEVKAR